MSAKWGKILLLLKLSTTKITCDLYTTKENCTIYSSSPLKTTSSLSFLRQILWGDLKDWATTIVF